MLGTRYRDTLTLFAFTVLVLAAAGYFAFAATTGEFGLYNKGKIEAQEARLAFRLETLRTERLERENRVKRLSDTYLDLDLLDEQARNVLGYARRDEIIIR